MTIDPDFLNIARTTPRTIAGTFRACRNSLSTYPYYAVGSITIRLGLPIPDRQIEVTFGTTRIRRVGQFPFFVLAGIRSELEKENTFLIINASLIDVYPSGMPVSGFKAYVQILHTPATLDQLINIFKERDSHDKIGTVEAQWAYHKNRIASL